MKSAPEFGVSNASRDEKYLLLDTDKKGRKTPQLWGQSINQNFRLSA